MNEVKDYLKERIQKARIIQERFLKEQSDNMERALELMLETYNKRGKFIFMGNGGSAADSQHAAAEFLGRFKRDREPIAAIALTTDTSTLTAISNDYSYEDVFDRQLKALVNENDLVFAISTSGNSKNILKAVKNCDVNVIGLTGGNGGELSDICAININVPLSQNSAETQEMHIFILHSLIDLFEKNYN